jgi:antirestriction protein ArdC
MNIYENITHRILNQLNAEVIPWRKTWKSGLPKSLSSGCEYRGINILVLGCAEYTSRYWLTFREAQRHGGHVRKGERATPVIYWKWRTPEELAKRAAQTGQPEPAPCVPFTSAVFNLDQVEGIGRPEDDIPDRPVNRLEVADLMLSVMPDQPRIVHAVINEPAYHPLTDTITLPHLSQFENADEYFCARFHELTHATGHEKRLNRFAEAEGDRMARYGFEELVAEFGAAFLCGFAGISNASTDALQASYIKGWSAALRQDPRMLVRAASAAQRAADYVRGKVVPESVAAEASATAADPGTVQDGCQI